MFTILDKSIYSLVCCVCTYSNETIVISVANLKLFGGNKETYSLWFRKNEDNDDKHFKVIENIDNGNFLLKSLKGKTVEVFQLLLTLINSAR
jgi:hypothetical protein